jgi:hypothetical protein
MRALIARDGWIVREPAGALGRDILRERAAQGHIEQLDPPADRERREGTVARTPDKGQLRGVACGVHAM